jgi:RND family efflux transporter MFP subunit
MINQLLLGAGVAVMAIGFGAQAMVSTLGSTTRTEPPPVWVSEDDTHVVDRTGEAERSGEAGFLGVVIARQSVELSARFDGTLERLNVQVGDHVKSGTPIARLDSRSIARDLAIAEAAVRVAEADHDRLLIEFEDSAARRERLHGISELVSREQLAGADVQEQMAAARLRGSVADLAGKRAQTDQLKERVRDVDIVAPFEGTIAARYVDAGTTVSRSTPIVRLISPTSVVVRFAVPEEQAAGVAVGREVTVRVRSAGLTVAGVIASIAPEIDAALRMVVVEARLIAVPGHPDTVPSGATARVLISTDPSHQRHAEAIGHRAVSTRDGSTAYERSVR